MTPSIRSVNRYSWAIGMIGTLTPASRPISGANIPPAFDDDLGRDRPLLAVLRRRGRRAPGRRATSIPITRVWVSIRTPRRRAPAASAWASPDGSSQPSVGQVDRAEHAVEGHEREAGRRASSGPISSRGSPNVLAQPAWRVELLQPLRGGGEPQRADLVPGRVDPGLGGQPPVELDAVHHHPGQGHARRGAGRRGRPNGRWSPRSARPDRPGGRPSSRARRGDRRCSSRRRRRR